MATTDEDQVTDEALGAASDTRFVFETYIASVTTTTPEEIGARMLQSAQRYIGAEAGSGCVWIEAPIVDRRGCIAGSGDVEMIDLALNALRDNIATTVMPAQHGRALCAIPVCRPSSDPVIWGLIALDLPSGLVLTEAQLITLQLLGLMTGVHLERVSELDQLSADARAARHAARAQEHMAVAMNQSRALATAAELLVDAPTLIGAAALTYSPDSAEPKFEYSGGSLSPRRTRELASRLVAIQTPTALSDKLLAVPVAAADATAGVLVVESAKPVSPVQKDLVQGIALAASGSIERLALVERLDAIQREANRQIVGAQERERSLIAADLHDGVLQQISASAMRLELAGVLVARGSRRTALQMVYEELDHVREGMGELRNVLVDLRPRVLDEQGLPAALAALADRTRSVDVTITCNLPRDPPRDVATTIFRIAQEGLTNVTKHAKATFAKITVAQVDENVLIQVGDNGVGFELGPAGVSEARGHLGLIGIRERTQMLGGTLDIDTAPGQGTTLRVNLPIGRVLNG